jgi:hypothetical protein
MGIRKLKRSIAHFTMAQKGIVKPNKKKGKDKKSFFSENWRKYAPPYLKRT